MSRAMGSIRALVALLACFIALPAHAGPLFDKLKDVLESRVGHDQMEMAAFSIAHPEEASIVYSHAASEDLPFFALVGAAKAAKGKVFPKLGKFDYQACVYPVTAIDEVFATADSKIDGAAGQAQTDTVVGMAQSYSASAAKQGSKAARDEINKQLIETIPYFGEIRTICTFAFETEFQTERNLQLIATDTSRKIKDAYDELSSGDVVSGVATLASLGVSADVACGLIDDAVGGGIIGRTPLLGDLAKGVCSSFAGKVIDGLHGIVHGGLGVAVKVGGFAYDSAKGAYCEVKSWFGGECESDPPPPTAVTVGVSFCAPHGGTQKIIWYTTNTSPDFFDAYCNDGEELQARPGKAPIATSAAERAAALEAVKARMLELVKLEITQRAVEWQKTWPLQCPNGDPKCLNALAATWQKAVAGVLAAHANQPFDSFGQAALASNFFESASAARDIVDEAKFRILPGQWAASYQAFWQAACEDNQCRTAVQLETYGIKLNIAQRQQAGYSYYENAMAALFAEADGAARTFVAEAKARSIEFNKKTTADAGVAWQILTNAVWGKQCLDKPCVAEVKDLSAKMRLAANLVQMGQPDLSSLAVQGIVGKEYGPKFQAAVNASKTRVDTRIVTGQEALTNFRAARPKAPATSRRAWIPASARRTGPAFVAAYPSRGARSSGGRPGPILRAPAPTAPGGRPPPIRVVPITPAPPVATPSGGRPGPILRTPPPAPAPGGRPAPIRIVPVTPAAPVAAPAGGRPAPIRIVPRPRPTPSPSPSPSPTPR